MEEAEETQDLDALWDSGLDQITEKDLNRKTNKIQVCLQFSLKK